MRKVATERNTKVTGSAMEGTPRDFLTQISCIQNSPQLRQLSSTPLDEDFESSSRGILLG